jgi:hypothetical protein
MSTSNQFTEQDITEAYEQYIAYSNDINVHLSLDQQIPHYMKSCMDNHQQQIWCKDIDDRIKKMDEGFESVNFRLNPDIIDSDIIRIGGDMLFFRGLNNQMNDIYRANSVIKSYTSVTSDPLIACKFSICVNQKDFFYFLKVNNDVPIVDLRTINPTQKEFLLNRGVKIQFEDFDVKLITKIKNDSIKELYRKIPNQFKLVTISTVEDQPITPSKIKQTAKKNEQCIRPRSTNKRKSPPTEKRIQTRSSKKRIRPANKKLR